MIAVLVAVVALSGCSGAPDNAPKSEPSLGPVPVITAPEQVTFPIDSFIPSIDQQLAIALHGQLLVNECAAAHGSNNRFIIGLDDNISEFRDYLADRSRGNVTRHFLWGVFDPSLMRQQGYAPPGGPATAVSSLSSGEQQDHVLLACVSAVETFSPTEAVAIAFYPSVLPDRGSLVHPEDSRWVSALAEWSGCMAGHGYSYSDPIEAVQANAEAAQDPAAAAEAKATALATAVADLDCKVETNLVGKGVAIQSAYDQIYVDSHRDELAAQQAQIAAFLVAGVDALPDIDSWTPGTPAPS